MKFYSKTDMGLVRTSNQDAYAYGLLGKDSAYGIVCDGMGGVNGGQIASTAAVECFKKRICEDFKNDLSDEECIDLLISALCEANSAILDMSAKDKDLAGMGTTCVAAIISQKTLKLINVGDSRAYIYNGKTLFQLTKDHSMVQHLVDTGQISPNEAKSHPQKNIITRAVGTEPDISADRYIHPMTSKDVLMLCTDGLSNSIEKKKLENELSKGIDTAPDRLISLANQYGGKDNITILILAKAQQKQEEF